MKKRMFQVVSLLMAFQILFVSLGLNVNFHYCMEDHHVLGSFGVAAELCSHCHGHEHDHEHEYGAGHDVFDNMLHFSSRCCCEDFESEVSLNDGFVFSTDDELVLPLQGAVVSFENHVEDQLVENTLCLFAKEKIPYVLTGRLRAVFYSSLKLDPDVC